MRLKQIVSAAGRLRHSKGYGIHSPFAFDFVTKVLRDRRSAYYDYPAVDALSRRCGLRERIGRMVYRIGVRFQPACIAADSAPEVAEILRLASPSATSSAFPPTPSTDFVVVDRAGADPEARGREIAEVVGRGGVALFLRLNKDAALRSVWQQANALTNRGMTFTNNKLGIIVGWRHLPRQQFGLWL